MIFFHTNLYEINRIKVKKREKGRKGQGMGQNITKRLANLKKYC